MKVLFLFYASVAIHVSHGATAPLRTDRGQPAFDLGSDAEASIRGTRWARWGDEVKYRMLNGLVTSLLQQRVHTCA